MPTIAFWIGALLGHGLLWVEVVNRMHGVGWRRGLVDAATTLCGLAVAGIPLAALGIGLGGYGGPPREALRLYAWFCLATLFVIAAMRVALRWDPRRCRRTRMAERETLDLRSLGEAATGSPLLGRVARLPGNEVLRLSVESYETPLDRLPLQADNLRVAHLTDIHMSGRLGVEYFRAVVDRINRWTPDLVCLTGDIVEHTPQLDWVEATLGRLDSPRLGAYFVLGNHDAKVDTAELRSRLAAAGWLDASAGPHPLPQEGFHIAVVGDERPWSENVCTPPPGDGFSLCLAHSPDRFLEAARAGNDLVLAGHCHGGQIRFPLWGPLLCPSRHGVRYASGTFRHGHTVMHVGRGTGSLFPVRWRCPPELALITLKSRP